VQRPPFPPSSASPTVTVLLAFGLLAVLWTLAPALTTGTLPRDTLEALYWGLPAGWSSPKHPPMAPFLADLAFRGSGSRLWAVYALGAGMTVAALAAVAWLGRETLSAAHGAAMALLSATFLLTLPLAHEFNPNVALLPWWVLVITLAWRAAKTDAALDWALLGLAAGLGLLAKYTIVMALAAAAAGLLATPTGRRRALRPWGALLAAAVMAVIAAPHLLAAAKGDFVTLHVAARDTIWEPERRFSLVTLIDLATVLAAVLAATVPGVLVAFLYLRRASPADEVQAGAHEARIYLIVTALAAPALTSVFGLLGSRLRAPWAMPLGLMLGPLLVALWPRLVGLLVDLKADAARLCLAAGLLLPPLGLAGYFAAAPLVVSRNPLREHVDGRTVARLGETYWQRFGTGAPPLILGLTNGALERQAMGSMSLFMPGRPPAYQFFWVIRYGDRSDPELERFILERDWHWIDMKRVRTEGAIAVAVGPEPFLWRRLGQCLGDLESMPLPVIRKGYRPQTLWLARILPGPADGGPCPPPPDDYREGAGLGPPPKTMDRFR
jgi:Dolichyl-phosphate-mannose-protein mannosyltransferase